MSTRPLYRYNEITGSNKTVNRELGISVQFLANSASYNTYNNAVSSSLGYYPYNGVFKSTYTTTEVTKNQLINYILTNPGERFFNPNYGSGIRQYLFENVDNLESIEEKLAQGISQNVQNIRVNAVNAFQDNNSLYITIDYSINNINDNLTLEINANE
jgi:phage baseplate assembly protein W